MTEAGFHAILELVSKGWFASLNMSKLLTCMKMSYCQNILTNTCKNRLWKPHKT